MDECGHVQCGTVEYVMYPEAHETLIEGEVFPCMNGEGIR